MRFFCIQLLYPRTDIPQRFDSRHKPVNPLQRRRSSVTADEVALIFDLAASELKHIRELRARNLLSYYEDCKSVSPVNHGLYCHCKRPLSGCMLRCELCLNYYHKECLQEDEVPDRFGRLLCSLCRRSAKPSLAKVGEIYADLRNIPVVMPEAICLRVLLQRAILWQIQARFSLSAVLEMFRVHAPNIATGLRAVGLRSFNPSEEEMKKMLQIVSCTPSANHSGLDFKRRSLETFLDEQGLRSMELYVQDSLRNLQPPAVLNAEVCAHLEELMLMGDLLEVSMEEIPFLWTVLKANHQQMNNIRVQPRSLQSAMSVSNY